MDLYKIFAIIFIPISFVSWSVIGNYLMINTIYVSVVVFGGTFVGVVLLSWRQFFSQDILAPSVKHIIILLILGLFNGIGVFLYSDIIVKTKGSPAAFITIISILMVIVAPIFHWILSGNIPTRGDRSINCVWRFCIFNNFCNLF